MSATRKTYSLPLDLAREVSAEAAREGKPESSIVKEALVRYFASLGELQLPEYVGSASVPGARDPSRPIRDEIAEMVATEILEDLNRGQGK